MCDMERDGGRSWASEGIGRAAYGALAQELPASEVWSLLLEVMARRAARRTETDLRRQWERDGFTRPSCVDQRTLVDLDGHLLAAAADFEAIELSPLAPLGSSSGARSARAAWLRVWGAPRRGAGDARAGVGRGPRGQLRARHPARSRDARPSLLQRPAVHDSYARARRRRYPAD